MAELPLAIRRELEREMERRVKSKHAAENKPNATGKRKTATDKGAFAAPVKRSKISEGSSRAPVASAGAHSAAGSASAMPPPRLSVPRAQPSGPVHSRTVGTMTSPVRPMSSDVYGHAGAMADQICLRCSSRLGPVDASSGLSWCDGCGCSQVARCGLTAGPTSVDIDRDIRRLGSKRELSSQECAMLVTSAHASELEDARDSLITAHPPDAAELALEEQRRALQRQYATPKNRSSDMDHGLHRDSDISLTQDLTSSLLTPEQLRGICLF